MRRRSGFTLIELLVVLFVLSLVVGIAMFSMGVFKSSHNLENTTQALSSRLRLAQMEALFEQEALGISVNEQGYQFYRKLSTDNEWALITDDSLFKSQQFPHNTKIRLSVNGKTQAVQSGVPQLILQQGLMSPFEMIFEDENKRVYEIGLNDQGEIVWTPL